MNAYLGSTNDGNANLHVIGHQGPRQGTKLASGNCKIANLFIYLETLLQSRQGSIGMRK